MQKSYGETKGPPQPDAVTPSNSRPSQAHPAQTFIPKPTSKPEVNNSPRSRPSSRPISRPDSQTSSRPISRPASRPASRQTSQPVSRQDSRPASRTLSRAEPRPLSRAGSESTSGSQLPTRSISNISKNSWLHERGDGNLNLVMVSETQTDFRQSRKNQTERSVSDKATQTYEEEFVSSKPSRKFRLPRNIFKPIIRAIFNRGTFSRLMTIFSVYYMISFWLDVLGYGYLLDPVRLVVCKILMLDSETAPPVVNFTIPIEPLEPELPTPEPIIEIPPNWYQQIILTTSTFVRKIFNLQ